MDMSDADARSRSLGAATGVSRRGFLRTAGAAGLAASAGTALFGAQTARAATSQIPFVGSYEGVPGGPNQWFDEIRTAGVSGLNGYRQYDPAKNYPTYDTTNNVWVNHFATTWPDDPYDGYAGPSVFSIYVAPSTVTGSQAAQTQHDIETLMTSAKNPHSYLSAWHEFGNIDYAKYGITKDDPDAVYQVHTFLCNIAALPQFAHVTYGPILFAPNTHDYNSLVAAFQSCPPGMGFYGVDVYGNNGTTSGLAQLQNFIKLAMPLDHKNHNPQLIIAETNTPLSQTDSFTVIPPAAAGRLFNTSGSSLIDGQPVTVAGNLLPSPLTSGMTYYVLNVNGSGSGTFQLSTDSFGDPLAYGSNGSGELITLPAPRAGGVGTGWFESVCATMANYGPKALGVLTYWNENGPLSGPWDPGPITQAAPAGTTVQALNNCISIF